MIQSEYHQIFHSVSNEASKTTAEAYIHDTKGDRSPRSPAARIGWGRSRARKPFRRTLRVVQGKSVEGCCLGFRDTEHHRLQRSRNQLRDLSQQLHVRDLQREKSARCSLDPSRRRLHPVRQDVPALQRVLGHCLRPQILPEPRCGSDGELIPRTNLVHTKEQVGLNHQRILKESWRPRSDPALLQASGRARGAHQLHELTPR